MNEKMNQSNKIIKTRRIAVCGVLTALAMVLSYVELQIPVMFAVPGLKVGLANIAIVAALYLIGNIGAIAIDIMRVIMISLLFGNALGFIYSLAGAVLSLLVMTLLKRTGRFAAITVSIAGAVSHNIGQILVAVFMTEISALYWYLIVLWFTGIVSGLAIGFLGYTVIRRVNKIMQ